MFNLIPHARALRRARGHISIYHLTSKKPCRLFDTVQFAKGKLQVLFLSIVALSEFSR